MFDPKNLKFMKSHEWLALTGDAGVVESVKAAFDIYAPVSGEVVAVNADAAKNPALVNQEPYGEGWLFQIKASAPAETAKLMDAAAYEAFLASEASAGGH